MSRTIKTFIINYYWSRPNNQIDNRLSGGGWCPYCGYGNIISKIVKRVSDNKLFYKYKKDRCLTYSSSSSDRSYKSDDEQNLDDYHLIKDDIYVKKEIYHKELDEEYIAYALENIESTSAIVDKEAESNEN